MSQRTTIFDINHKSCDLLSLKLPEIQEYIKNINQGTKVGVMFICRAHKVDTRECTVPNATFTNVCVDLTLEVDETCRSGSKCTHGTVIATSLGADYTIKEFREEDRRLFTHDGLSNNNNLCYWWHMLRSYVPGYELDKRMFVLCDIVSTSCVLVAREVRNKHRVYSTELMNECNTVTTEQMKLLLNSDIGGVIAQCNLRALDE